MSLATPQRPVAQNKRSFVGGNLGNVGRTTSSSPMGAIKDEESEDSSGESGSRETSARNSESDISLLAVIRQSTHRQRSLFPEVEIDNMTKTKDGEEKKSDDTSVGSPSSSGGGPSGGIPVGSDKDVFPRVANFAQTEDGPSLTGSPSPSEEEPRSLTVTPPPTKGLKRLSSVRRQSLDPEIEEAHQNAAAKAAEEADDAPANSDEETDEDSVGSIAAGDYEGEERVEGEEPASPAFVPKSASQIVEERMFRSTSKTADNAEGAEEAKQGGMDLGKIYQRKKDANNKFKTPRGRWINAIHTVLRGVRAVNAFMPKKKKAELAASNSGKKKHWNVVKKTAVQQAVQNRMAMEFKVADATKNAQKVGFQFGKSADAQLFENCLGILKTQHRQRSRPDIIMLLSLLKGNQFFANLEYEVKLDLAKIMGLQSHKEGTNVFKQGDVGNLFYIVMQGEADVFVNHMGIQFKACTYAVGGSFGERALLTSEPRAATVTCVTDCDFLVISKRDYLRVLREVHEREFMQKIEFLRTVRYFGDLPAVTLEEIATKFTKKRYGSNEVIVQEGEKRTHLNIIRNGECRVLKKTHFGHLEIRQLSSRDFFGEDGNSFCAVSILSRSFAEVYCIHVNDMKNSEMPALLECVKSMKAFADRFAVYQDADYLVDMYRKQEAWEKEKALVLKEIREENKRRTEGKRGVHM
jgi:CRP-like cAMP-binding protein